MKNFLGIEKTPPALERSLKAATKLKAGLPMDLEVERLLRKRLYFEFQYLLFQSYHLHFEFHHLKCQSYYLHFQLHYLQC